MDLHLDPARRRRVPPARHRRRLQGVLDRAPDLRAADQRARLHRLAGQPDGRARGRLSDHGTRAAWDGARYGRRMTGTPQSGDHDRRVAGIRLTTGRVELALALAVVVMIVG